jgi:hypothetical protein
MDEPERIKFHSLVELNTLLSVRDIENVNDKISLLRSLEVG